MEGTPTDSEFCTTDVLNDLNTCVQCIIYAKPNQVHEVQSQFQGTYATLSSSSSYLLCLDIINTCRSEGFDVFTGDHSSSKPIVITTF